MGKYDNAIAAALAGALEGQADRRARTREAEEKRLANEQAYKDWERKQTFTHNKALELKNLEYQQKKAEEQEQIDALRTGLKDLIPKVADPRRKEVLTNYLDFLETAPSIKVAEKYKDVIMGDPQNMKELQDEQSKQGFMQWWSTMPDDYKDPNSANFAKAVQEGAVAFGITDESWLKGFTGLGVPAHANKFKGSPAWTQKTRFMWKEHEDLKNLLKSGAVKAETLQPRVDGLNQIVDDLNQMDPEANLPRFTVGTIQLEQHHGFMKFLKGPGETYDALLPDYGTSDNDWHSGAGRISGSGRNSGQDLKQMPGATNLPVTPETPKGKVTKLPVTPDTPKGKRTKLVQSEGELVGEITKYYNKTRPPEEAKGHKFTVDYDGKEFTLESVQSPDGSWAWEVR